MSQVLSEGYSLFKNHTLANLVPAEHGSLLDISTPDQTGKSSSGKKPLKSLWTMLYVAPQYHGLNCHIHAPEKPFFLYSSVLQKEKSWRFLACSNNQWESLWQYRSHPPGIVSVSELKNISLLKAIKIMTWKKYNTCLLFSLAQCSLLRDTKCLIFLATEIITVTTSNGREKWSDRLLFSKGEVSRPSWNKIPNSTPNKQLGNKHSFSLRAMFFFLPGHLILLLLQEFTCTSGSRIWQRAHTTLQSCEHLEARTQRRSPSSFFQLTGQQFGYCRITS